MSDSSMRILIIDDEKDVCEVLKLKFEKMGFSVQMALDGHDGYQKAVQILPHCILLDIRMPREDGLTFLRKLRATRHDDPVIENAIRKTPVIILTAAGEQMKPLFQTEGVSAYIGKPYDFEKLREAVSKLAASVKS